MCPSFEFQINWSRFGSGNHKKQFRTHTMKTTLLFLFLIITVSTLSLNNVVDIKTALTPGIYECGFCEFVIFTIYTYVTSSSTESQIATVVDEVCNYVPSGEEALVKIVHSH